MQLDDNIDQYDQYKKFLYVRFFCNFVDSGNEDGTDEAIPMMVSVASSSARVTAAESLLPALFSPLLSSLLGITSQTAKSCNEEYSNNRIYHNELFSFGKLLFPNVINFARHWISIFPSLVIFTIMRYPFCCQ